MFGLVESVRNLKDGTSWEVVQSVPKAGKLLCVLVNITTKEKIKVWADKPLKKMLESTKLFTKEGQEYNESRNLVSKLRPVSPYHTIKQQIYPSFGQGFYS